MVTHKKPSKDDEDDEDSSLFVEPVIYGSAILNNTINIGIFKYSINNIVRSAFFNSGMGLEEWNALSFLARDEIIGVLITLMRSKLEENITLSWIAAVNARVTDLGIKKRLRFLAMAPKYAEGPLPLPKKEYIW